MDRLRLRLELEDLFAAYAACLDDGELERWPEFFTDDCRYEIIPRENFERGLPVAEYSAKGDSFTARKPRVWSETRLLDAPFSVYDLAPDGRRFAVVLYTDGTAEQKPITHLTFLQNFFDYLRQRVPVGGK